MSCFNHVYMLLLKPPPPPKNCFRFQRWTFGWYRSSRASCRWRNWWWTTMTHQMRRGAALRLRYKKSRVLMTSTLALPWPWSRDAAVIAQVKLGSCNFFLIRGALCLCKNGENPSDVTHYVPDCINRFGCVCFRWPLVCDVNDVNSVAAFFLLPGMRYKRRGVDTDGHVANYVETEQLIHVHSHTLSFVQTRGSVPVFWSQAGYRYNPRPRLEKGQ